MRSAITEPAVIIARVGRIIRTTIPQTTMIPGVPVAPLPWGGDGDPLVLLLTHEELSRLVELRVVERPQHSNADQSPRR